MAPIDSDLPTTEQGAALSARIVSPINSLNPSSNLIRVEAYRRYSASVNPSQGNYVSKLHEVVLTITLLPSGHVYEDACEIDEADAGDLIGLFRDWLLERLESNELDTVVARQYVAVFAHTSDVLNPTFRYQFEQLLASLPENESSHEVDRLIEEMVEHLGWTYLEN